MREALEEQVRKYDALAHIKRNGSLMWWDGSADEAARMFRELESEGRIKRNVWSGNWQVVESPVRRSGDA